MCDKRAQNAEKWKSDSCKITSRNKEKLYERRKEKRKQGKKHNKQLINL
jgi:hypothetical protein